MISKPNDCTYQSIEQLRTTHVHQCFFNDEETLTFLEKKIKEKACSNRNYTNVKASSTDWQEFINDEHFAKVVNFLVKNFSTNNLTAFKSPLSNDYKITVFDAWGIQYKKGDKTIRHDHSQSDFSTCLYFSEGQELCTCHGNYKPHRGLMLTLSGWDEHWVEEIKEDCDRCVLVFNWIRYRGWEAKEQKWKERKK